MRDNGTVLFVTTTVLCSVALFSVLVRLLGTQTSQKKWIHIADDWYMMLNAVSVSQYLSEILASCRPN